MGEDTAILLNPSAGGGRALKCKPRLEYLLRQHGIKYSLHVSESEDDLRRMAALAAATYPVVVGAGGDTTFNIIAKEIIESGHKPVFGVVGIGSSNDITKEFGVETLEKACSALRRFKTRKTDVGLVSSSTGENYFLGTASIGLGVSVNKHVERDTRKHPWLANYQTIAGLLGVYKSYLSREVPVCVDISMLEESLHKSAVLFVFNNTSYYASGIRPSPSANPYDGKIDCCIIEQCSLLYFLYLAYISYIGKGMNIPIVTRRQAPFFRIGSDRDFELQVDGKIIGASREFTVEVLPRVLNVVVGDV